MTRRYIAYAPHAFASGSAKTAHGVMRYSNDEVVCVVDPECAGKIAADVVPFLRGDSTPIVATIEEALTFDATSLLLGTAPQGGALPASWRADILVAIARSMEIVSGLHDFLGDDAEFTAAARISGSRLWDVRAVPSVPLFSGAAYRVTQPILLTVGNDCAVGKMSASLELCSAAKRAGADAAFVPTGQTGIMIAGWGIAIDRVIADFATGAAEHLVIEAASKPSAEMLVVEGQGAINHPAYAPVTLALLYGCAPDALLLVCEVDGTTIEPFGTPRLSYTDLIATYEQTCALVKPASVLGIALNTRGLSETAAREHIDAAHAATDLPCDDIVRFGADALYAAIAPQLHKRATQGVS